MKHFAPLVLFLLLSIALVFAESEQLSLNEVLTRHTNAIGGQTALQKIRTLRIHLHISEPTFEVDGVYVADRTGYMRIDIIAGGKRVYTEGFDGKNGWQMGEDSITKDESAEGTLALQNGIYSPDRFFSLQELMSKGATIELKGREKIGGINYHVLRLNINHSVKDLYIHPDTWLIERSRETKATHPDIDPTPRTIETVYSDFRKVDGILRSFQDASTEIATGKIIQSEKMQKIEANVSSDLSLYSKPSQ